MNEPCADCVLLAERLAQIEKRIYERFTLQERVQDEKWAANTAKLEGMNEFRAQLTRQAGSFVTWGTLVAVSVGVSTLVEVTLRIVGK
jgi:hypothetical protein